MSSFDTRFDSRISVLAASHAFRRFHLSRLHSSRQNVMRKRNEVEGEDGDQEREGVQEEVSAGASRRAEPPLAGAAGCRLPGSPGVPLPWPAGPAV